MNTALIEELKKPTHRDGTAIAKYGEVVRACQAGTELDPDEVAVVLEAVGKTAEDLATDSERIEERTALKEKLRQRPEARRQQQALEAEQRQADADENQRRRDYEVKSAERRAEMMRLGTIADSTWIEAKLVLTAPQYLRDRDNALAEEIRPLVLEERQLRQDIEDHAQRVEQFTRFKSEGRAINEEMLKVWNQDLARWRERLAVVAARQAEICKERDECYAAMLSEDF